MPLSANAIIDLADAKLHLGISGTSQDALVEALIDQASEMVEVLLAGAKVIRRTITDEDQPRPKGRRMHLNARPIVTVTQVRDSLGTVVDATTYQALASDGVLEHDGLWPYPTRTGGGPGRFRVTYSAGIAANFAAVPFRIRQACRLLVGLGYQSRAEGVANLTIPGVLAITFDRSPESQTQVRALLAADAVVGV